MGTLPEGRSQRPIWLGSDERKWDHFRIHLSVLQARMGTVEFAVFAALIAHAEIHTGEARPSVTTVAGYFGLSDRTVRRAVGWLEEQGWIRVDRVEGKASHYFVLPPPTPDTRARGRDVTPDTTTGDPGQMSQGTPDTGTDEQEVEKRTTPLPPPEGGSDPHQGQHTNCRACGTNQRGPTPEPTPYRPPMSKRDERRRGGAACPECDEIGWILGDDAISRPCQRCNQDAAAI